ncbi:MAG: hypothetical protein JW982_14050 [Spirochaetes bacterium]|nr:hypothetical protein [Spirochaetota bacterium]
MKKLKFLVAFLIFLSAAALYAQDTYFEDDNTDNSDSYYEDDASSKPEKNPDSGIPITIGFQIGSSAWAYGSNYTYLGYETTETDTTPYMNFGLFLDAKYFRFSANYFTNTGKTQQVGQVEGSPEETYNYDLTLTHLDIQGLLKFPFSNCCQNFEIWPALGLAYSKVLKAENYDGSDVYFKNNINDLWLCFVIGTDYIINKNIVITLSGQMDYCLTPNFIEGEEGTDVSEETGIRMTINLGAGYRFN